MARRRRRAWSALTNYEVLHDLKDTVVAAVQQTGVKLGLIADEVHRLNPQAQMTKAGMALAQVAAWRVGQSGTVVLNGIEDVWSQWYLIDLGVDFGANYVQYRREFLMENPWAHTLTPLPGALEDVGQRMPRRGLRYRKVDCLDLPPCSMSRCWWT